MDEGTPRLRWPWWPPFTSPATSSPMHSGAGLAAAARLASLPAWRAARLVKANPDAPQLPVRARALTDRPQGIRREHLDAARIAAILALATRAPRRPYN